MQYMHNAMLGCVLAVERAFSLFGQFIFKQQEHSMEDYIESSLMLRYDKRD